MLLANNLVAILKIRKAGELFNFQTELSTSLLKERFCSDQPVSFTRDSENCFWLVWSLKCFNQFLTWLKELFGVRCHFGAVLSLVVRDVW